MARVADPQRTRSAAKGAESYHPDFFCARSSPPQSAADQMLSASGVSSLRAV